jgi:hypothetical protein
MQKAKLQCKIQNWLAQEAGATGGFCVKQLWFCDMSFEI